MLSGLTRCCYLFLFLTSAVFAQDVTAPPQEVRSFEDLVRILETENINHKANAEEKFVIVPINKGGLQAAQVIRWSMHDGVVHFIQVIPLKFKNDKLPAIESAMIRLNHGYPVPGLGMNHENNTPYFRLTVPLLPRQYLLENEVKEYFSFCVNQAINFTPTLLALSKGEIEAENVLDYQRAMIQEKLGPIGVWKKSFGGSEWIMQIQPNGETTLMRDGKIAVDSMVSVKEDKMMFDDVNGDLAVDGIGTYTFKVKGTTMTFIPVEDPGEGRKQVLSEGAWSR
ncbi:YbjN domain-containing protein [bacterium]|nr:YbjN domain-containing protein [bacterium]